MQTVEKKGLVINNDHGKLTIKIARNGACGSCSASGNCAEKKETIIEAFSHDNINIGDEVVIESSQSQVNKLTVAVYVFPVVMVLIGALIPNLFMKNSSLDINLLTLLFVLVFLAISVGLIKLLDTKLGKRNIMKVRKI